MSSLSLVNSGQFRSEGDQWIGNSININGGNVHNDNAVAHLIESLTFTGIWDRHHRILPEYPGTYSWLLNSDNNTMHLDTESSQNGAVPQSEFIEWLRSDEKFYWICGTAGAGKSTLLSFMVNHEMEVKRQLARWAHGCGLMVISFFFWKEGREFMQKSICGLLRSLIVQMIVLKPGIVNKLQQLSVLKDLWSSTSLAEPPWTRTNLEQLLANTVGASDSCVCFFIDALDEFHGYYGEKNLSSDGFALRETIHDLIGSIRKIAALSNVKVCVTSRPGNAFDHAFSMEPRLDLQTINEDDIRKYSEGKLSQIFPVPTAKHFASLITFRSQGIFLWVELVVNTIYNEFVEYANDVEELERRIDEFPSDLNQMYHHMLSRLDPRYKDDCLVLFKINDYLRSQPLGLQITPFLFCCLACHNISRPDLLRQVHSFALDSKSIKKVIQSRGCGILEIRASELIAVPNWVYKEELSVYVPSELDKLLGSEVGYIHRTAKDFIGNHPEFSLQRLAMKSKSYAIQMGQMLGGDRKDLLFAAGIPQSAVDGGMALLKAAAMQRANAQISSPRDMQTLLDLERSMYQLTLSEILNNPLDKDDAARFGPRLYTNLDKCGMTLHSPQLAAKIVLESWTRDLQPTLCYEFTRSRVSVVHLAYCGLLGFTGYVIERTVSTDWTDDSDIPQLLELAVTPARSTRDKRKFVWLESILQRLANRPDNIDIVAVAMRRCLEVLWTSETWERYNVPDADRFVRKIIELYNQFPELISATIDASMKIDEDKYSEYVRRSGGIFSASPVVILCLRTQPELRSRRDTWDNEVIAQGWPIYFGIHKLHVPYFDIDIDMDEEQSAFVMEDITSPDWPFIELGTRQQCLRRDWLIWYNIARLCGLLTQDVTWQSFLARIWTLDRQGEQVNITEYKHLRETYQLDRAVGDDGLVGCEGYGFLPSSSCVVKWSESYHNCHGQMCEKKLSDCHEWFQSILSVEENKRIGLLHRFIQEHPSSPRPRLSRGHFSLRGNSRYKWCRRRGAYIERAGWSGR